MIWKRVEVGRCNRVAVRDWFVKHVGGTQRECAKALGLSEMTVNRHVRSLRSEWRPPQAASAQVSRRQSGGSRADASRQA